MNLYIFTNLTRDNIIKNLISWKETGDLSFYYAACGGLLNAGAGLNEYIASVLLENPPSAAGTDKKAYFERDIKEIYDNLIAFDWDAACKKNNVLPLPRFKENAEKTDYRKTILKLAGAVNAAALGSALKEFFGKYSCADEAKYSAFKWQDGLCPISSPDDISFSDLAALGYKKEALTANTEAFVNKIPANDVLLVGAAGTGKSSCIKAVFNMFSPRGLKLVELFKEDIHCLPRLMDEIKKRKAQYIVFIDDLSFDGSDEDYKTLKVTLDGQIEKRPANMLLYATSNRNRLVKETWKDRESEQDIHENETLQEKMSLSERFGIRLYFPILSPEEYFEIVSLLLKKHGVTFNAEIEKLAVQWEMGNNGLSGRTAKQFVTDYMSRAAKKSKKA